SRIRNILGYGGDVRGSFHKIANHCMVWVTIGYRLWKCVDLIVQVVKYYDVVCFGYGHHVKMQCVVIKGDQQDIQETVNTVGYDNMSVQLRVALTGIPMIEHRSNDAFDWHVSDTGLTSPRLNEFTFSPGHGFINCLLVCFLNSLLQCRARHCPQG